MFHVPITGNAKLRVIKELFELAYFWALLKHCRGNVTQAQRISGIGRPYLYKRLHDFNLDPDDFRPPNIPAVPPALAKYIPAPDKAVRNFRRLQTPKTPLEVALALLKEADIATNQCEINVDRALLILPKLQAEHACNVLQAAGFQVSTHELRPGQNLLKVNFAQPITDWDIHSACRVLESTGFQVTVDTANNTIRLVTDQAEDGAAESAKQEVGHEAGCVGAPRNGAGDGSHAAQPRRHRSRCS